MAISFPTSIDTLTNPTSSDTLDSPSHSDQHSDVNDAVEALEAKVGANSSAVTSSHDYKIDALEDAQPTGDIVGTTDTQTLTNKTLSSSTNTFPKFVEIGSFSCPGTTGDYSVSGLGFTPRVIEFTVGIANATNRFGFSQGTMSSSTQWVVATAGSTTEIARQSSTSDCLGWINTNGTWYIKASYNSLDSDGFTVNFSTIGTGTIFWKAWA